ncbi:hypothetical protein N8000_04335 [Rhodospirillales bacterium]|nr:hypothetical protein [Rhodospirillales bacterium]
MYESQFKSIQQNANAQRNEVKEELAVGYTECEERFNPVSRISGSVGKFVKSEPLLRARGIRDNLTVVYENSMAGALRIRARDGDGVAWLPLSLVKPDLDAGLLARAGNASWSINLQIRMHRTNENTNDLTRKIWNFLKLREGVSLVS